MEDPLFGSLRAEDHLQATRLSSRSTTPAIVLDPPPSSLAAASLQHPGDARALFDPLGISSHDVSTGMSSSPPHSSLAATTHVVAQRPKRRPSMIATPSNPTPPSSHDPLRDLLEQDTRHQFPAPSTRSHPPNNVLTTPSSQVRSFLTESKASPSSHFAQLAPSTRATSKDVGSLVSVPVSIDPLSSSSSITSHAASSVNARTPLAATRSSGFATAAKERHAQNASRILGELERSDKKDFLGWLEQPDDQKANAGSSLPQEQLPAGLHAEVTQASMESDPSVQQHQLLGSFPTGPSAHADEQEWSGNGVATEMKEALQTRISERAEPGYEDRTVQLLGRASETAGIMTRGLAAVLRPRLPALARLSTKWSLLYSMDQHGVSLQTFYRCSSPSSSPSSKVNGAQKGALLVVRDALDGVFGAWIDEGIPLNLNKEGHHGGGGSFLWRAGMPVPDPTMETANDEPPEVEVYLWSGRNDYVALCETDSMSLGGGEDGKTGLYLSSSLLDGSSARCITFNNEILCAETEEDGEDGGIGVARLEGRTAKFEIVGVEVWGLAAS